MEKSREDILIEYAAKAEKIYNERIGGDYTWLGFLEEFLHNVESHSLENS